MINDQWQEEINEQNRWLRLRMRLRNHHIRHRRKQR
jgi:hypothetical protein